MNDCTVLLYGMNGTMGESVAMLDCITTLVQTYDTFII